MGVGLQEGYIIRHDGARNAYDQCLVTICSDIIQDVGVENALLDKLSFSANSEDENRLTWWKCKPATRTEGERVVRDREGTGSLRALVLPECHHRRRYPSQIIRPTRPVTCGRGDYAATRESYVKRRRQLTREIYRGEFVALHGNADIVRECFTIPFQDVDRVIPGRLERSFGKTRRSAQELSDALKRWRPQ